jgi:hypothetical protein
MSASSASSTVSAKFSFANSIVAMSPLLNVLAPRNTERRAGIPPPTVAAEVALTTGITSCTQMWMRPPIAHLYRVAGESDAYL